MPNQLGQLGDRGTTKALQVRYSLSPDYTLNLMPEVAAVVPIDSPELQFHVGWRQYASTTQVAAVAAQFARIRLRVPDKSNTFAHIQQVTFSATANLEVGASLVTPALALPDLTTVVGGASGAGIYRDSRMVPVGSSQALGGNLVFSKQTDAAAQSPNYSDGNVLANTLNPFLQVPVFLFPSSAMDFFVISPANQIAIVSILWRERIIQEQENTP